MFFEGKVFLTYQAKTKEDQEGHQKFRNCPNIYCMTALGLGPTTT